MNSSNDNPHPWRPELLAAYVDGELSAADAGRVEEWLAEHPEFRDQLAAQQSLSPLNREFWQAAAPSVPAESDWTGVLHRIKDETAITPSGPAVQPRTFPRWLAPLATLAATVVIAFHLWSIGPFRNSESGESPWPVAGNDDVDILSMQEVVRPLLVVGQPPLQDPVDLVTSDDIILESIGPDSDGFVLSMQLMPGQPYPMICAPREAVTPAP